MEMYRIAVIGDPDSVLGFKALGLEVCPAEDVEQARQAIHRMAKENYAILYLTEQLAAQLQTNGCDITETMLGHIETGYRSTSIFEIDKLAEALKVDYNALFAQD